MKQTASESIEHHLTIQILRGEKSVGSSLDSIRDMATQFSTTVPTIQRAVDRLAASGLVTVRHGSGIRVNDPERISDLSLLPLWFEALADQPTVLAKRLADFLELRRVIAAYIVETRLNNILPYAAEMAQLTQQILLTDDTVAAAQADAALSRIYVTAANNFAITTVFGAIEQLALQIPSVAEALYGDRENHRSVIQNMLVAVTSDNPEKRVLALLEEWDSTTVDRFILLNDSVQRRPN